MMPGNDELLWRTVKETLRDRPGWRFEADEISGPGWCFGEDGAARIVVSVHLGQIIVYTADNDEETHLAGGASLAWWLVEHESEHSGLTDLQIELGVDLLPGQVEGWLASEDDGSG